MTLRPGDRCAERDAIRGRAAVATENVRRHGDSVVVRLQPDAEAHFCVRRMFTADRETLEAHFDWEGGALDGKAPPSNVQLFVELEPGELLFLGAARCTMYGSNREVQYSLRELPQQLDAVLRPATRPLDGAALREVLRDGCDTHALAARFAESWLGPLPRVAPPRELIDAPAPVRRWHALWAQLATFPDHPWCCWPACWRNGDFQDEWQNGGTFAFRDERVWMHRWWTEENDSIECAKDMPELALQFVLYGLTEGSQGYYVHAAAHDLDPALREPLPVRPWPSWLGPDASEPVEFVGGDGYFGTVYDGYVTARAVSYARARELAARVDIAASRK